MDLSRLAAQELWSQLDMGIQGSYDQKYKVAVHSLKDVKGGIIFQFPQPGKGDVVKVTCYGPPTKSGWVMRPEFRQMNLADPDFFEKAIKAVKIHCL
jgi:hypothetical protein